MSRILVIEDNDEVRLMLRELLEKSGYEIAEAPDGEAGVRIYRQEPADLVITDIMMPNKDGVETIRELRRDFPDTKIIAITGFRGSFNRLPAAECLGARETLVKPFTAEELLNTVERLLAEHQ